MDYESLLSAARMHLEHIDEKVADWPAPQVTVLVSSQSRVYAVCNDAYEMVLAEMTRNQDTHILRMLTLWKDGQLELPYHALRKALAALDQRNLETAIYFSDERYKKLAVTI